MKPTDIIPQGIEMQRDLIPAIEQLDVQTKNNVSTLLLDLSKPYGKLLVDPAFLESNSLAQAKLGNLNKAIGSNNTENIKIAMEELCDIYFTPENIAKAIKSQNIAEFASVEHNSYTVENVFDLVNGNGNYALRPNEPKNRKKIEDDLIKTGIFIAHTKETISNRGDCYEIDFGKVNRLAA